MIDLHTHILPGLDDGPIDLEESLEMANTAVDLGIHTLLATPHVHAELYPNNRESILAATDTLAKTLRERDIPLRILPGSEVLIHPELVERYKAGELMTLNDGGKYLLVEYPSEIVPPFAEEVLFELQLCGVTPVIAHPERNRGLAQKPELIFELASRDILMQVTAGSITGRFGPAAAAVSKLMLKNNLVHFIATDMHYNDGRGQTLKKALAIAVKLVGKEQVRYLTEINAKCILRGSELPRFRLQESKAEMEAEGIWHLLKKILKK